ncbi:MAG: HEAT repeat domain-containing protein [Pseudomonadota bacterium]
MPESSPTLDAQVHAALVALGSRDASATRAALVACGEDAVGATCVALLRGDALGSPGANGRAVFEDLEDLLVSLARAHPARWLDAVARAPDLMERMPALSATGWIEGPEAAALLHRALGSRDGTLRWLALSRLWERRDPGLAPRLGALLSDRDGLVVHVAVKALRAVGGAEHLPALRGIAGTEGPVGTREAARDAVEAILTRLGQPLDGPARLLAVPLPPDADLCVEEACWVRAGERLADTPAGPVLAPCAGVVVGFEEGAPARLVLRRDPPA